MKLLWLGSSGETEPGVAKEQRNFALVQKGLSESLGEEVDVAVHTIWPNERLPELVGAWMDEHQPDMVIMASPAFSCCYESVPLRLGRKLGPVGRLLARAGYTTSEMRWLASTRLYHAGRKFALRFIGGDYYFEPEEVLERLSASIRAILRQEGTVLMVGGTSQLTAQHGDPRRREEREARLRTLNRGLVALCGELRVPHRGLDRPTGAESLGGRLGDRLHLDAASHQARARIGLPRILEAWRAQHPETGSPEKPQ